MAYDIYTDFEKSMVKVIQGVNAKLNVSCIPIVSHSSAPEPTQDYVAINTLRLIATGRADSSNGPVTINGGIATQYLVQNYEVVVQLTFVGKNAGNNAMTYHSQYSGNTPYREIFTKNNLSIRRRTDVRRSPQLRENVWVNAYAFDMTLGFAVRTAHEIDWADKITVNGELIPLP